MAPLIWYRGDIQGNIPHCPSLIQMDLWVSYYFGTSSLWEFVTHWRHERRLPCWHFCDKCSGGRRYTIWVVAQSEGARKETFFQFSFATRSRSSHVRRFWYAHFTRSTEATIFNTVSQIGTVTSIFSFQCAFLHQIAQLKTLFILFITHKRECVHFCTKALLVAVLLVCAVGHLLNVPACHLIIIFCFHLALCSADQNFKLGQFNASDPNVVIVSGSFIGHFYYDIANGHPLTIHEGDYNLDGYPPLNPSFYCTSLWTVRSFPDLLIPMIVDGQPSHIELWQNSPLSGSTRRTFQRVDGGTNELTLIQNAYRYTIQLFCLVFMILDFDLP